MRKPVGDRFYMVRIGRPRTGGAGCELGGPLRAGRRSGAGAHNASGGGRKRRIFILNLAVAHADRPIF